MWLESVVRAGRLRTKGQGKQDNTALNAAKVQTFPTSMPTSVPQAAASQEPETLPTGHVEALEWSHGDQPDPFNRDGEQHILMTQP